MNIKSILVSQPKPKNDKNPFLDLATKHSLKVDFRPFIHVREFPLKTLDNKE